MAERFHLKGVEWVRVRKAGRRVFVMVSFFEDPDESLQGMDQVRQAVIDDVVRLDLDADVVVIFRPAPAAAEAPDPGSPPPAVAATGRGRPEVPRSKLLRGPSALDIARRGD